MMNMKLSQNFTLEEMTRSATAQKKGIDNTPPREAVENLSVLCRDILQPIRDAWGDSIIVTSGYRCPKLNSAVGGAKNSQHCYGSAADIKCSNNKELFRTIQSLIKLGKINCRQLIDEYNYSWIHISTQDTAHSYKLNEVLHLK